MDYFEAAVSAGLGPLEAGTSLIAAVSGGADSTAMLLALARLREEGGFSLRVVHVEHGIRPAEESRGDARAVAALCETLGLACRVISIPPGHVAEYSRRRGTGIEAAARHFRYLVLRKEAHGVSAVVVAHTQDDALELSLMRLLRGAGPGGLAAMPFSRNIAGLTILRPLLALSRSDVEGYLTRHGLPWRSDTTNRDERYFRNRIRATLVPLLETAFPGWKQGLEALGSTQSLAAEFINAEARRRIIWEPGAGNGGAMNGSAMNGGLQTGAENFFAQPPIIREEALFQALNVMFAGPGRRVPRRNLRRFALGEREQVDLGFCRIGLNIGDGGKFVLISRQKQGLEAGFSLLIKEPGPYKLKTAAGKTMCLRVSEGGGTGGFFARLPLVLRFAGKDDVVNGRGGKRLTRRLAAGKAATVVYAAQDGAGVAAFIVVCPESAVILRREAPPGGELFFCDCNIGGIDVQQSE
jgi:tRNA(Ile)-lysidine synthase